MYRSLDRIESLVSESHHNADDLVHTHFFFVDVVGLSNPQTSTKTQIKKIRFLNTAISSTTVFKETPAENMVILPTGDGMAIGFLQGPELPLRLALELHREMNSYNRGKIPSETIGVRIGIHSGSVFIVDDVKKNTNVWGPGIIIARRVMDLGDDGHILLSARTAEDLRDLSDTYRQIIHPIDTYAIKHGTKLLIYSAFGKGFGNPATPEKILSQSKAAQSLTAGRRIFLYPYVGVEMSIIDPKSMTVHYKRTYQAENISDRPIATVIHGIATDVEKRFSDMNIEVHDEEGRRLEIADITMDKPFQKEFTTRFDRPLEPREKSRYTLEYDVQEPDRYFENAFLTNCKLFEVKIEFPSNSEIKDIRAYEINQETEKRTPLRIKPGVIDRNSKTTVIHWSRSDVLQGQSFRFEW